MAKAKKTETKPAAKGKKAAAPVAKKAIAKKAPASKTKAPAKAEAKAPTKTPAKVTKPASAVKAALAASKAASAAKSVAAKAVKKQPVAPKKTAKSREGEKSLDLCLILDCTSSMGAWIERSKDTLHEIIDHVISANSGVKVRVSFVAYRDIKDYQRFDVLDFTDDINAAKQRIQK